MFEIELIYRAKLGNLTAVFTTREKVTTREDAEHLRTVLLAMPALAQAEVKIKSAGEPTADEAMDRFLAAMRRNPPVLE